jgi:hypothetical protein
VASGMSSGGALEPGPSGARLGGGVNPDQAVSHRPLWSSLQTALCISIVRSAIRGKHVGCPRFSLNWTPFVGPRVVRFKV